MRCSRCNKPMEGNDLKHPGVLFEVRGWERLRAQGGQNHVIERARTGAVMCHHCAGRIRAGLDPGQGAMPV